MKKKETNFDIRISREVALNMILFGAIDKYNIDIMCKDFDQDELWSVVTADAFDALMAESDYDTFEIRLNNSISKQEMKKIIQLYK